MLLEEEFVLSSVKREVVHMTGLEGDISLIFLQIQVEAYIFTLILATLVFSQLDEV